MLQDQCGAILHSFSADAAAAPPHCTPLLDPTVTPMDKQHDVWGSSVFSLPELGSDMVMDSTNGVEHGSHSNILGSNISSPAAPSSACVPVQVMAVDEQTNTGFVTDAKTATPSAAGHRLSFVSSGAQSAVPSVNGCNPNGNKGSSLVYTPQTNQLSLSSLMSVGTTTTIAPNCNTNNTSGMMSTGPYSQSSPITPGMQGNIPTFFAAPQGAANVMMFAAAPSAQTLCISAGAAPTMMPYFVIPSPHQPGLELGGAMAYSPVAAASQPMGAVMCNPWHTAAGMPVAAQAPGHAGAPAPPSMGAMAQGMPAAAFVAQAAPSVPQPVASYPPNDMNSTASPVASPMHAGEQNCGQKLPKGSPPSYDSLRLQLTKRRQPPGRQRSGINVHGSLQGTCGYFSYNLSAALKQYEQPDGRVGVPGDQVLPVFIQMFPCELRDRTIVVLNRVVEATCGPDIATVVGIEPRSETSFIALVRTNAVWLLIHKLRCRVLMDRHGFWYANDMEQYARLKEYCENVRRLPQQTRHFQTDGLPCMPLVVELSRSINAAAVKSPQAPPSFDEVSPIATVERHARPSTASGSSEDDTSEMCESFIP